MGKTLCKSQNVSQKWVFPGKTPPSASSEEGWTGWSAQQWPFRTRRKGKKQAQMA